MLFDLSSPRRKNVVRVVYGLLAVLFAGGFIFFGIGSESGAGGLFDGLFGDGSSGSTAEQYEQQIEDAETKLETDPQNANALATLARYRYLSGTAQLDQDQTTGAVSLTEEARQEFESAIDAWTRYLDTKPPKPDVATAANMVQAYYALGDAEGAADAQAIQTKNNPSAGTYSQLAFFRYASYDIEGGDEAAKSAVEEAPKADRKSVEKQLDRYRELAVKQKKKLAKLPQDSAAGEEALGSPFGGLGGAGGTAPAPIAP
jgi:tetratricopeptide (TPR) repeat protein